VLNLNQKHLLYIGLKNSVGDINFVAKFEKINPSLTMKNKNKTTLRIIGKI